MQGCETWKPSVQQSLLSLYLTIWDRQKKASCRALLHWRMLFCRFSCFIMGFDPTLFVSEPAVEFVCTICSEIFTKPVSCPDGHVFCESCLCEWLKTNKSCPTCRCRLSIKGTSRNRVVEGLINALKVRCEHASKGKRSPSPSGTPRAKRQRTDAGCPWTGTLAELSKHRAECPLEPIPCPAQCGATVKRGDLPAHQRVCPERHVQCKHCKQPVRAAKLATHNAQLCPKAVVTCPNRCGKKCAREKLATHLSAECPLELQDCPFASLGCTVRPPRSRLAQHLQDNAVQHSELTVQQVQASRRDVARLQERAEQLERDLAAEQRLRKAEVAAEARLRTALEIRFGRSQTAFDEAQTRHKASVKWAVTDYAKMAAAKGSFTTKCFPIAGYDFRFKVGVSQEAPGALSLFLYHAGGSPWVPIHIGRTTVTLKSSTDAFTRMYPPTDAITANLSNLGWSNFIEMSEVADRRLCTADTLHFEAEVLIGIAVMVI